MVITAISTTCTVPSVEDQLRHLIVELVEGEGLTVREATEQAARQAAAAATRKGWCAELVDFVVIHTAHLGAQYQAAHTRDWTPPHTP